MLRALNDQLDQKKSKLNDVLGELKTTRDEHTVGGVLAGGLKGENLQRLSTEFANKKRTYDAKAAALESNLSRLDTVTDSKEKS